jgi:hypothetical protein
VRGARSELLQVLDGLEVRSLVKRARSGNQAEILGVKTRHEARARKPLIAAVFVIRARMHRMRSAGQKLPSTEMWCREHDDASSADLRRSRSNVSISATLSSQSREILDVNGKSRNIDVEGPVGRQVLEKVGRYPDEETNRPDVSRTAQGNQNAKPLFWPRAGWNRNCCRFRHGLPGSLHNSISKLGSRADRGSREGSSQESRLLQSQARFIRRAKQNVSRFLLRHRPVGHVVPESVQQVLEIGNIHCPQTRSAKSLQFCCF